MNRRFSLKKNSEFQYVYKAGKRFGSRTMTLVALRSRGGVRVGFSISKKVGKAVTRNRIKRVLRECMRPVLPDLRPCRLVFVARQELAAESFASVNRTVCALVKKAGVLNGSEPAKKDMMR